MGAGTIYDSSFTDSVDCRVHTNADTGDKSYIVLGTNFDDQTSKPLVFATSIFVLFG
jgi:hypothetical protein